MLRNEKRKFNCISKERLVCEWLSVCVWYREKSVINHGLHFKCQLVMKEKKETLNVVHLNKDYCVCVGVWHEGKSVIHHGLDFVTTSPNPSWSSLELTMIGL